MGLPKITWFIVLLTFSLSTAFNTLVPFDKEVIYDYKALVKAGTHVTASFASQFVLHGKLHLQANSNATFVKFTDLKYQLYNGVLDHVHEYKVHDVPLPAEVVQLQDVFKIVYDTHGKVIGIATSSQEKEFSRNIKKAVASILQLDVDVLKGSEHPHATSTEEHSIYGYTNVLYNVFTHEDMVVVHKMHDMPQTYHMYKYVVTNNDKDVCEAHYEDPFIHDSQRKYYIVKQDGHQIVKYIEANGGFFYHPFQDKSEAQYLFVNQTFELNQIVPVQTQFQVVQSEHFDNELTYNMFAEESGTTIMDLTHGRKVHDYSHYTTQVHEMLEEISKYMHIDHLDTHTPNIKQGQSINRIHRLLLFFDLKKIEELHTSLIQKTTEHDKEILKIFYHILPMVGTKATMVYIKNLVVQKKVSDEVAVVLVQNLGLHVKAPTTSLITEMEELINLGDNIHWNVKKVAILTFATLVHKSYEFQKRMHSPDYHFAGYDHTKSDIKLHYVQETSGDTTKLHTLFEKYVIAFVEKIKSTTDYKIQITYLTALYNMKVDGVLKYLKQAVKGEWFPDHHFRLMSLWCIGYAVSQHPHDVYEVLWPILTNPHEHTELRTGAYYLIMETHPTLSNLMNIFWVLMKEANEELYNFHYTYIESMAHTVDPCHQDYKIKAAQLLNYMHPPAHGVSYFQTADYVDYKYGFGRTIQSMFVNTNESYIFAIGTFVQYFHQYFEDTTYYIKVHGLDHKVSELFKIATQSNTKLFNFEDLMKIFVKIPVTKDIHIEVFMMHHAQIINTYYFNAQNAKELALLFDFFVNEQQQTMVRDYLQMYHDVYSVLFMPTDMGFVGSWEQIIPVVRKWNINTVKEVVNKVVNVHMDNSLIEWIHSRFGLSFYNPIVDVWQGIGRYYSFDMVIPMYADLTINTQQQSMKFSIKKHQDVKKDIGGVKGHATMLVFIKDDFQRNLLKHSSPESNEFEIVTNGDKYRHDYLIAHKDDINIGRKWMIQIIDSEHHVSNGTFSNMISALANPVTKNTPTLWTHLLLSYFHWNDIVMLLPRKGTHGLLIRTAPSTDHDVTHVDVSVRFNYEIKRDNFVFTPGMKFSTRVTHAVKNEGQSLKTWDINAIVDMNPGHTVNNLKMHLTRIIPGQKDYKVCVEGVKKWSHKDVTGHLNVAMSTSDDGKCVKDDTVVDVTMIGERSEEQDHEHHKYGACQYIIPYFMQHYHTMECLAAHTSIRNYVYNVKTTNVPTEFKKTIFQFWDMLKGFYYSYYNYEDEHNEDIGDNNFKVEVMYPMTGDTVDVKLKTKQSMHEISSIQTDFMKWIGFVPDVTLYSSWYMNLHSLGLVHHCTIYHDHFVFDHHHMVKQVVGNDWMVYASETAQSPKYVVYVKGVADNKIAIKLVEKTHTFEIIPHGDVHQFIVDGKQVPTEEHIHHEDWMTYQVMTHDVFHPVIITMPHFGIHVEYEQHFIQVVLPKTDHPWHGYCFN